ncbi:anti-repressor SinI family protein [Bacillus fonticola]|uniref:anti-repressor SinI family protein n=1 Tax=Bacillus fonticola TaxID=2728853 RepID=UPI001476612F|nr:anti-repressor SinI family protein [Bacillus fonticola]
METIQKNEIDKEWVYLLYTAKQIGLSPEEVRAYLNNPEQHLPTISKIIAQ